MSTEVKEPVKFTKKYEVYNDEFELVSKEVEVSYTEVASNEAALEVVNRYGNYIEVANSILRKEALKDAKTKAGVAGGINSGVLMEYIKPFRENAEFAKMVEGYSDKRQIPADKWKAQTEAILAQLKQLPFVVKSIKERSALIAEEE